MPDPLMDTLDEIDRKSGTFLLSPRVSLCLIRYRGTLLVTEGTSLQPRQLSRAISAGVSMSINSVLLVTGSCLT